MANPRTIKLKKYLDIIEEYTAAATFYPGHLLMYTSVGKVQKHNAAGQSALPMFALEDELQGNDIDDQYGADDKAQCWIPQRGEQVYAILNDGETISKGDDLESAGNGNLQKYIADVVEGGSSAEVISDTTLYTNQIVAQALEAKDLASSSGKVDSSGGALGYDRRIKVRIA